MTKKVINKTILDRKAGNWFAIPAGKITKLFLASKCVSFAIICKITHQDIGFEFHFSTTQHNEPKMATSITLRLFSRYPLLKIELVIVN